MGSLLVELLPFVVGLIITPAAIAAAILFLGSRRPVPDATAFAAAFVVVYGVVSAAVLAASVTTDGPLISPAVKSAVALVVGVLLLGAGLAELLLHLKAAAGAPGWMAAIDQAGPLRAFALGAGLALANPNLAILLAGLAAIAAAALPVGDQILAAAVLVAASAVALVAPVLAYAVAPGPVTRALAVVKNWLIRLQRTVNTAVFLAFGALFTLHGLSGLQRP